MRKPAFCIYENKDADQIRGGGRVGGGGGSEWIGSGGGGGGGGIQKKISGWGWGGHMHLQNCDVKFQNFQRAITQKHHMNFFLKSHHIIYSLYSISC